MMGSVERLRQLARRSRLLAATPMMLLVIGGPRHRDPITKRNGSTGTGGVLPIPATASPSPRAVHLDSLVAGHRDTRAERGRVLYAPGHVPRDTAASRPAHKHACPVQRVVAQARTTPGPNS